MIRSKITVKLIGLLALFELITGSLNAQDVSARLTLDSNKILIGDQINAQLIVEYPDGIKLFWPQIGDTLSKNLEVLDRSQVDTIGRGKNITLKQNLTITSFDSGYYVIRPIQVLYSGSNDTTKYFANTEPVLLEVHTVPVDTTQAIKDIKPPINTPFTMAEVWAFVVKHKWWFIGGLAVLIIAASLIYYYASKEIGDDTVFIPQQPPHERAMEALNRLKLEKLWQQGKIKHYYSGISEIIRQYFEERFQFNALEMTTDEIAKYMSSVKVDNELKNRLVGMLELSDLVKFAKEEPLPAQNESSMEIAEEFVRKTIPEPELPSENNELTNSKPVVKNYA